MRFSLSLISATMLATLAIAAPTAPQENSNSELDTEFIPAQNTPLEMSEKFQPFNWMAVDDAKPVDRTFTLNLAEPAQLQITDYKLGGDSFEILDNGEVIGSTSETTNEDQTFVDTPEEAFQDERFSHGTFDLPAGEHSITINVANSPFNDGTGAVRLVQKLQALNKKGKGGKGKKGGWGDDDDDEDWDDDDDDEDWDDDDDEDWEKDDKKGDWDDDKKGGWGDDKKGGWGDDKGGWGDDKKGGWGDDKKGGWGDDKKGGWGDDKKGDWDHGKGWDKKNTVYVYYTVPASSSGVPTTVTDTVTVTDTTDTTGTGDDSTVVISITSTDVDTVTFQSVTALVEVTDVETDLVTETATHTDLALASLPFTTIF